LVEPEELHAFLFALCCIIIVATWCGLIDNKKQNITIEKILVDITNTLLTS
jgi:hypothetical protein